MSSWVSIVASSNSTSSAPNNNNGSNSSKHSFKSIQVNSSPSNQSSNNKKSVAKPATTSGSSNEQTSAKPKPEPIGDNKRKFMGQKVSHESSSSSTASSSSNKTRNTSSNGNNHHNGYDYSGWKTEQYNLKRQMILRDHKLTFDPKNLDQTLKFIGGVDISFENGGSDRAIATLIILSFPDLKIVHEESEQVEMTLPYIAGYLAFREVPHIQQLVENVRNNVPHLMPQVILVDGNGHLHQRGFGSACHLGVLEDIPTIGVAKKILMIKGLTDEYIYELEQQLTKKGDCIDIDIDSERRIGCILKTDNITNVYISPGHRVCLDTAISIVKRCSLKSIPEPIYQADLISRNHVKKCFKKSKNPKRY